MYANVCTFIINMETYFAIIYNIVDHGSSF